MLLTVRRAEQMKYNEERVGVSTGQLTGGGKKVLCSACKLTLPGGQFTKSQMRKLRPGNGGVALVCKSAARNSQRGHKND